MWQVTKLQDALRTNRMLLCVCVDAIIIAIFIVIIIGGNGPLDSGNEFLWKSTLHHNCSRLHEHMISHIPKHLWISIFEIKGSIKALTEWFECVHGPELSIVHLFSQWSYPPPLLPSSLCLFILRSFLMSNSTSFRQNRNFSFFCSSPSVSFLLFLLAHLPSFQTLKGVQSSNIRPVPTTTKKSALSLNKHFLSFFCLSVPHSLFSFSVLFLFWPVLKYEHLLCVLHGSLLSGID